MRRLLGLAIVLSLCGCKSKEKQAAPAPAAAPAPPPSVEPVGMTDPFSRLASEPAKALQKGYKAEKAKKYDEAAAAFREVTAALPDYTPARYQLVRVLALGGQLGEVPKEYEALIARDFVGYANALDTKKDFAALRAAPEWKQLGELKDRYRTEYAKGLDTGFFFVARTRSAGEPHGTGDLALDLKQEVFHYDPASKRFRRLTETGGHAFAIARSSDGKTLAFLSVTRIHRDKGDSFVDPQLGSIDLSTLETTGPAAAKGRFDSISLGFDRGGAPVFELRDPESHQARWMRFDTARTALAAVTDVERAGGFTTATPAQVTHVAAHDIEGVKLEDGASQFTIGGVPSPVVAARPLAADSLDWSPSRSRITYAGKIDACKILKGGAKDKNELFVFDMEKKIAQRVAAAVSSFSTLWLDDDQLVYEGGVGRDGVLHLYSFAQHADSALPTRYGAGLYGVPTLACDQAQPSPSPEPGDDGESD